MYFTGTEHFDCNQAELFARLVDMGFLVRIIPDLERVVKVDATGFTCRVRPRFSFLTGSLELTFELLETTPPESLKVRSTGKGIGAAVIVEAEIQLATVSTGTDLQWSGTIVSREGLLKPIGPALIQAAAERVINSFWQKFREAMKNMG